MKLAAFVEHILTEDACNEVPELLAAGHAVAAMAAATALIETLSIEINASREAKLGTLESEAVQAATREALERARAAMADMDPAALRDQARALARELAEAFQPETPSINRRGLVVLALGAMTGLDVELDPACAFLPAWYKGRDDALERLANEFPGSFAVALEVAERKKPGSQLQEQWRSRAADALSHPQAGDPRVGWLDAFLRAELGSKAAVLAERITGAVAAGDRPSARDLLGMLQRCAPDDDATKRAAAMVLAREADADQARRDEAIDLLSVQIAAWIRPGVPESIWLADEERPAAAELLVQRACLLAGSGSEDAVLDDLRRAVRIHRPVAERLSREQALAGVNASPSAREILAAKEDALLTADERTEDHLRRAIGATIRHAGDIDTALVWSERAVAVARARASDDWRARALAARSRILLEHDEKKAAKAALEEAERAAAGDVSPGARADVALARAMSLREAGGVKADTAYKAALEAARACGERSATLGYVTDEVSRYLNGKDAPLDEIAGVLDEGIDALSGFLEDTQDQGEHDRIYGAACVDLMSLLASRAYVADTRGEATDVAVTLIRRATVASRGARSHGFYFSRGFTAILLNLALKIDAGADGQPTERLVADFFDALGIAAQGLAEKRYFRTVRRLAANILEVHGAAAAANVLGAAVTGNLPEDLAPEENPELFGLFERARRWPGFMTTAAMSFQMAAMGMQSLADALEEVEALAMTYVEEDGDEGA